MLILIIHYHTDIKYHHGKIKHHILDLYNLDIIQMSPYNDMSSNYLISATCTITYGCMIYSPFINFLMLNTVELLMCILLKITNQILAAN